MAPVPGNSHPSRKSFAVISLFSISSVMYTLPKSVVYRVVLIRHQMQQLKASGSSLRCSGLAKPCRSFCALSIRRTWVVNGCFEPFVELQWHRKQHIKGRIVSIVSKYAHGKSENVAGTCFCYRSGALSKSNMSMKYIYVRSVFSVHK